MAFRILNPTPGGRAFTTDRQARKYVASGQAKIEGRNGIRFLDTPEQHELTQETATKFITGGFYDKAASAGKLNLRQAAGIPFVGPMFKLGLSA